MPYIIPEIGEEPKGALLRRCQILRWLGVDRLMFDKIVRECLLPYRVLIPGGVKYFRREDVVRRFLNGFKPTVPPKEVVAKPRRGFGAAGKGKT